MPRKLSVVAVSSFRIPRRASSLQHFRYASTVINETPEWRALEQQAAALKSSGAHLKNLLQDQARCAAMVAEFEGIVLDYSRQFATSTVLVRFPPRKNTRPKMYHSSCLLS